MAQVDMGRCDKQGKSAGRRGLFLIRVPQRVRTARW